MTQSGKSYFAEKNFLNDKKRQIIIDFSRCFKGVNTYVVKTPKDIKRIFDKYKKKDSYKIILRSERNANNVLIADMIISLASALGRMFGSFNPNERVWLVVDEADNIVTSRSQSRRVKHLVNCGRHDNVDSVFIARNPNRLHTDIRANASQVFTFKLSTAPEIKTFMNNFGRENCKKITTLEKFHYFYWDDTGLVKIEKSKK